MNKDILIQQLKDVGVISNKKVILRSGEVSDYYCDIKKSFGYPNILNSLADKIGSMLPDSTTCIAASGYGGLTLASTIASRFNKKLIMVRNEKKDHGKNDLIVGYTPENTDKIVIVDDVVTSGSSVRETLENLGEHSRNVQCAIVVVKRGEPKITIPYQYILEISEIL